MKLSNSSIVITVRVHLPLWDAIKLRIAGVYSKPHESLEEDKEENEKGINVL